MHPAYVGRFVEGFIDGFLGFEFRDLHHCIGDVATIQSELYLAVHDFD